MFKMNYLHRTSSNFQPAILKATASEMLHFSSSQCTTLTPATICTPPITSEESRDVIWNVDLCDSLGIKMIK